jgi:hypothetical protein
MAGDKKESSIKLSEMNSAPTTLVRPSSLNYKISLSEGVNDFIKKDMPLQDDQFIDIHTEDPKFSSNNNSAGANKTNPNAATEHNFEDFDDIMFDMTTPNNAGGGRSGNSKVNKTSGHPQTPFTTQLNTGVYVNESG